MEYHYSSYRSSVGWGASIRRHNTQNGMHALRVASAALALGLVAGSGPAAAGARQYGSRNLQQQGRRRRRPIDNSSVVQEAFDADGISLGYLHDPDANWTESQAGLMVLEGAPSFSYHRNASY